MSNPQTYVGNAVTSYVTFTNPVAGQDPSDWPPVDPSTVTLVFVPGTGQAEITWTYGGTGSIVKVSTGVYSAELTTTGPGAWRAKWVGTGACAAIGIDGWNVLSLPF